MTIQSAHLLLLLSFSPKLFSVLYSPYNLPLLANLLLFHCSLYLSFFIYYWKINPCLWWSSNANNFVSFFKFSFSSVVLYSSLLWWMLQNYPDIFIIIAPPCSPLKLFLAVMPTEVMVCKMVCPLCWSDCPIVYFVFICILSLVLKLYFLWAKSCLVALCLSNASHNGILICGESSSVCNGKNNLMGKITNVSVWLHRMVWSQLAKIQLPRDNLSAYRM